MLSQKLCKKGNLYKLDLVCYYQSNFEKNEYPEIILPIPFMKERIFVHAPNLGMLPSIKILRGMNTLY